MKNISLVFIWMVLLTLPAVASDKALEAYVKNFNYESRLEMKISSKQLIDMLEDGKAVLIDIRFKEEQEAWGPSFAPCINARFIKRL